MAAAAAQQAAMAAALQSHNHLCHSTEMPLFYRQKDKDTISAHLFFDCIETAAGIANWNDARKLSEIYLVLRDRASSGGTLCSTPTSTGITIKLSRPISWRAMNHATWPRPLAQTFKNLCNVTVRPLTIITSGYTIHLPRCVRPNLPPSGPSGSSCNR